MGWGKGLLPRPTLCGRARSPSSLPDTICLSSFSEFHLENLFCKSLLSPAIYNTQRLQKHSGKMVRKSLPLEAALMAVLLPASCWGYVSYVKCHQSLVQVFYAHLPEQSALLRSPARTQRGAD